MHKPLHNIDIATCRKRHKQNSQKYCITKWVIATHKQTVLAQKKNDNQAFPPSKKR